MPVSMLLGLHLARQPRGGPSDRLGPFPRNLKALKGRVDGLFDYRRIGQHVDNTTDQSVTILVDHFQPHGIAMTRASNPIG